MCLDSVAMATVHDSNSFGCFSLPFATAGQEPAIKVASISALMRLNCFRTRLEDSARADSI